MPKVPMYERQFVGERITGVRYETEAPLAAFGGGASLNQLGETVAGVANTFKNIFEEEVKRADLLVATELENDLMRLESGLQSDIAKNYQGVKALEAREFANNEWVKNVNRIKERVKTRDQWLYFARLEADSRRRMHQFLSRHEAAEYEKYENEQFESNVKNFTNLAVQNYSNPSLMDEHMRNGVSRIVEHHKKRGLTPEEGELSETTKQSVRDFQSAVIMGAFERYLNDGDFESARALFESKKDFLNEKAYRTIQETLNVHQPIYIADQIFKQLSEKRNAAGHININAGYRMIEELDLNPQQKKKVISNFDALVENDRQRINYMKADETTRVIVSAIAIKQRGGSVTEAINVAQNSSGNLYDKAKRIETVTKIFEESFAKVSDPYVYLEFYEQAVDGRLDATALDGAFKKNLISLGDYRKISERFVNQRKFLQDEKRREALHTVSSRLRSKYTNEEERALMKFLIVDHIDTHQIFEPSKIIETAEYFIKLDDKKSIVEGYKKNLSEVSELKNDYEPTVIDGVYDYLKRIKNLAYQERALKGEIPKDQASFRFITKREIISHLNELAVIAGLVPPEKKSSGHKLFMRGEEGAKIMVQLSNTKNPNNLKKNSYTPRNFLYFFNSIKRHPNFEGAKEVPFAGEEMGPPLPETISKTPKEKK